MKSLYKSPEISVEELTKTDVLCESDFRLENRTVEKNELDALTNFDFIDDL